MRIFISHSSQNSDAAEKLCAMLEEKGFSCFIAPRDIRSGFEYAEELVNGIDNSDLVVLLLSKDANDSPHVLREIERAVSKKKSIIVYKLEEVTLTKSLEYFLMTHQWVNTKPGDNFEEIIKCVSEYAARNNDSNQPIQPSTPAAPVRPKRKTAALPIIAAAVFLAAAAVVTIVLTNNRPKIPDSSISDNTGDTNNTHEANNTYDTNDTGDASNTSNTSNTSDTSDTNSTYNTSNSQPENLPTASAELGQRITLGTYNGEPIEWRVIHLSEDKTKAVVISDKILTMKAFDTAEGGSFNEMDGESYWSTRSVNIAPDIQRLIRGDNRWELSNIRIWLNSAKENVLYTDQAPISTAMSEKRGGYHTEAGFLNGFTEDELSALVESDITTNGVVTKDKVFLLSEEELKWLEEADVSIYTTPTEAAVSQDKSGWYKVDVSAYNTEDFIWWLREPNTETACECRCVNLSCFEQERKINSDYVGLEGYGIRPAMTIDLTSDKLISILEN